MIAALTELATNPVLSRRPSGAGSVPLRAGVRRLAPAASAEARRPPARDADRPELGLRARHADRPRLRRALHRRARGRHPRPRARDRGARLHDAVRTRRRAGRHPHGDGGQPAGDDRRRPHDAPQIPSDAFDCAIVTQTLQFVYDVRAALATLHRILAPGGVLLATVPGITKISPPEDEQYGEWWHYTGRSARRLAEEAFGAGQRRGRRRTATCSAATGFLYGLAASDLRPEELDAHDRALRGDRRPPGREAARASRGRRRTRFAVRVRAFGRRAPRKPRSTVWSRRSSCPAGAGGGRRRPRRARPPRPRTRLLDERRQRERERRRRRAVATLPERVAQPRVDDEPARRRRPARAPRRRRRAPRSSRRSRRSAAPRTSRRGTRSAPGRCASRTPLPCSCALCSHCAGERSGKWKHSTGNQPRSGANGLSTSAWLPRVSRISGMRPMDDLADRLVERRGVVDRRERGEAHRHPLGEVLVAGSRARTSRRNAPTVP